MGTPLWAVASAYRSEPAWKFYPPRDPRVFGAFAGAVAARYGEGGAFWREHPDIDPLPIAAIELWNEANMHWAFRPEPDPVRYAAMVGSATYEINRVDPRVVALVGGLDPRDDIPNSTMGMRTFLDRMFAAGARPEAIAVHSYGSSGAEVFPGIAKLRGWMDRNGLTEAPIYVTEWGYPDERFTADSMRGLEEGPRGALLRTITSELSRSDCGVAEVHPHTWDSDESYVNQYSAFNTQRARYLGLAQPLPAPATGFEVFGETEELGRTSRELLGLEGSPAREAVHICGRAAPDRDGDRVEDQHDYAPLDAAAQSAPETSRPAPYEPPSLRPGEFATGRTVGTRMGTWDGSPVPDLDVLRWEHCSASGDDCRALPDSSGASLALPDVTGGRRVRAVVRARNAQGDASATTPLSDVVGFAPRKVTAPYLGGTFKSGKTVWMHPGTWEHVPHSHSILYQWYHCAAGYTNCRTIGGPGAENTLVLSVAHANRYIMGTITLTNAWGSAGAAAFGSKVTLF